MFPQKLKTKPQNNYWLHKTEGSQENGQNNGWIYFQIVNQSDKRANVPTPFILLTISKIFETIFASIQYWNRPHYILLIHLKIKIEDC